MYVIICIIIIIQPKTCAKRISFYQRFHFVITQHCHLTTQMFYPGNYSVPIIRLLHLELEYVYFERCEIILVITQYYSLVSSLFCLINQS